VSSYFSAETCALIEKLVPPEIFDQLVIIIDKEMEAYNDAFCDGCDKRMPDEPMYNEGYL